MKKLIVAVACTIMAIGSINAQNTFNQGDKVINLGVGLGSVFNGNGYSTSMLPISGSFEIGIKDNLFDDKSSLGIGGIVGYTSSEIKYPVFDSKYKASHTLIGARGLLHYQLVDKLDTYGALTLGYDIVSGSWSGGSEMSDFSASASAVQLGLSVGGRYYFTDKIAAMAELGYDIAYLKIGVAIKL